MPIEKLVLADWVVTMSDALGGHGDRGMSEMGLNVLSALEIFWK